MRTQRAQDCIERLQRKKNDRSVMNHLWEEVAEVLAPERRGFISKTQSGRDTQIYDNSPILAKRGLVNAIGSMLRPKSSAPAKWFDIVPIDEDMLDEPEVKAWVDRAEDILWRHIYNPDAHFAHATGEIDDDLVTFGTAAGYVGLRPDMTGLLFKSFHLKQVYLDVDALNMVTGVYIVEDLSPRQAADLFGEPHLGPKTIERLHSPHKALRDEKSEYVWRVTKRHDRNPAIDNNLNMMYSSLVIDVDSEHEVDETGFEEMPFFIPRWDTRMSGSTSEWGRGPGILALPSVLTLNQMGKTMLRALHRAVDPPWLLPSDSMVNAPQLRPGGVSYYDAKAIRNLGLAKPFQQMDSSAQIPWGLNAQTAEREIIMAVFFKNILSLPIDAPAMTATEVIDRRETFVREIGAVFGRLERSYTNPMVERAFNILLRKGAFGPPESIPEVLLGTDVQFRFASPVEKAKRQIEEAGVNMAMDRVLQIGQMHPEIMNRFNLDAYGKFMAKSNDFPIDLLRTDEEVAAAVEAQAQAAAAEQQMQMAERLAPIAAAVPEDAEIPEGAAAGLSVAA